MQKVIINKLGPIEHAEIPCTNFMVFTGSQSAGKSTIAKAIYFFRGVKDDIFSLMIKRTTKFDNEERENLNKALKSELREKFLRIFGSSWGMDNNMFIEYYYDESTSIKVSLKEETRYENPNYLWIDCSQNIRDYLYQNDNILSNYSSVISDEDKTLIKKQLSDLFSDKFNCIYIPAGRSLITLLATQLNYIYSTMEDAQKRAIDYCTRIYLERILKIRPEFENGLSGLINENPLKAREHSKVLQAANELIIKILKGKYRYNGGDERLEINNNHYVKINFMSSGQQEVVWILNLLFYYLLQGQPTFFIIEEPESHLFPESQKYVSELISLVKQAGNDILLTTHSPYVLGSLNNLLYADQFPDKMQDEIAEIIDKNYWINNNCFSAWFVKDGFATNGMDSELHLIKNELIDEISQVINDDYDKMFELQLKNEGESD